jgi:hypothetical protein
MAMSKLTLSVDGRIVSRAKTYAKRRGVSVSKLVEDYLAAVAKPDSQSIKETPVLNSLRGCLKKGRIEEYRKHLVQKYR